MFSYQEDVISEAWGHKELEMCTRLGRLKVWVSAGGHPCRSPLGERSKMRNKGRNGEREGREEPEGWHLPHTLTQGTLCAFPGEGRGQIGIFESSLASSMGLPLTRQGETVS